MANPLKELRGGRTQHEAAKLLKTDAMAYSRWERGVHLPRKNKWPLIKEKTGISPDKLFEFVVEVSQ